jgi:intracellular multiplication protein IcmP
MAGGGGGGQQNSSDNSMGALWILGAMFVFGGIGWVKFKTQIIAFYFHFKLMEIKFLSFFTSGLDDVRSSMLNSLAGDTGKLSFEDLLNAGQAVGTYLRYPLILLIVIMAGIIFFTSSTREFKKTYSMKDLVFAEKANWPQIAPVSKLDLVKTDIDKGPWAMELNPIKFCKNFNLLEEFKRPVTESMSHKDWNKVEVTLRRGPANKLFAIQLGSMWPGIDKLPPHVKALFSIFAARLNGDGKGAADLLAHINKSTLTKLDFTGTEALCKKHYSTKLVQKVLASHAYLLTMMAEMLFAARTDGVQASADFLWLKPIDRKLWYMLNTVGRQTPFVEVAGAFSHWTAERDLGRPLLVPMVEEATNALEVALSEIIYKADEV